MEPSDEPADLDAESLLVELCFSPELFTYFMEEETDGQYA